MIHFSNPPTVAELKAAVEVLAQAQTVANMLEKPLGFSDSRELLTGNTPWGALYWPLSYWMDRIKLEIAQRNLRASMVSAQPQEVGK